MIVLLADLLISSKNKILKSLNHSKYLKSDLDFLHALEMKDCHIDSNNKILLVEINNFHFECLDSIVYYFESLGFGVDVVVRKEANYNNAIKLELGEILSLLNNAQQYDFIFLNTMILSLKTQHHILDLVKQNSKYGILGIYHSISDICKFGDFDNYKSNRYFALRSLKHRWGGVELDGLSCSREIDINFAKNDIATFISIGFPIYHRNFRKNLYRAIENLLSDGIEDFRFILIGRSDFKDLRFQNHISFFKNPSNDELLDILKRSNPHYTLGIFDSFAHRHYLTNSTSGLRQFSLMYSLPFVINERFGISFGFDTNNAILYRSNFFDALKEAIGIINTGKYDTLKSNLQNLNARLNLDSTHLLRERMLELKNK